MSDDDRAGLMDALLSPLMLSPRAVQDPQALGTAARSVPGFERTLIDRLDELADGAFGLRTELNGSLDRPHGTLEHLDARVATLRTDAPELAGELADTNGRLHGLESEVTRAVLTGAAREDIDEVIDTSLASDAEKAALRLYSWSLLSRFEAHRLGGEQRTA